MRIRLTLTHLPESGGKSGLKELTDFYAANPSKNVKERDPEQLLEAMEDSKVYVVRDEDGALRGVCGMFEYGDGLIREVGGVRVILNGFGLQTLLMSLAVAMEYEFDRPEELLYAATAHDNEGSIISILRTGFADASDLGATRMSALGLTQLDLKKRYFLMPPDKVHVAQQNVLKALSARRIVRPEGVVELDIQPPFTDLIASLSRATG